MNSLSHVQLFATPWTVAHQAPLSLEFSRQEYWSGLPFPSPGDLPDPGIEPGSLAPQADSLPSEPAGKPKSESFSNFCINLMACHVERILKYSLFLCFLRCLLYRNYFFTVWKH